MSGTLDRASERGMQVTVNQVQQRRLAGAVRAEDRPVLRLAQRPVQVANHRPIVAIDIGAANSDQPRFALLTNAWSCERLRLQPRLRAGSESSHPTCKLACGRDPSLLDVRHVRQRCWQL